MPGHRNMTVEKLLQHIEQVSAWRKALSDYELNVSEGGSHVDPELRRKAEEAFDNLGGQGCCTHEDLSQYDHERYGPFLGVSDPGLATLDIASASCRSPKALTLQNPSPMQIGVSLDAERIGSNGEVPVGPNEYKNIRLDCMIGRLLTTTNVGVRSNVRYFQRGAEIQLSHDETDVSKQLADSFDKFINTPDQKSREATAYLVPDLSAPPADTKAMLVKLAGDHVKAPGINTHQHKLCLLARALPGENAKEKVLEIIKLAKDAGFQSVAVDAPVTAEAQRKISMPSLLNMFSADDADDLLRQAQKADIGLSSIDAVDCHSTARTIWQGLNCARNAGVHLGKYGLQPMTLEEQSEVVGLVQSFLPNWAAAPAFYVDFPLITKMRVYDGKDIFEAASVWLAMVARHGVKIVLFDSPDRDSRRRLVKRSDDDDEGVLTLDQIRKIMIKADGLGVKTLWAGGVSPHEAYELAQVGLFGLYTTSTTAVPAPVSDLMAHDPNLPAQVRPTEYGVLRVKSILEAGYLKKRMSEMGNREQVADIEKKAQVMLDVPLTEVNETALEELCKTLTSAWRLNSHVKCNT